MSVEHHVIVMRNGGPYYHHKDTGSRKNYIQGKVSLPSISGNMVTKARSISTWYDFGVLSWSSKFLLSIV